MTTDLSVDNEQEFQEKASYIEDNLPDKLAKFDRRMRFVLDIIALFRYMTDPDVHWAKKAVVVAALLYFIIPVDAIPDMAPVVGYLDDIGVIGAAIRFLGNQLRTYYP